MLEKEKEIKEAVEGLEEINADEEKVRIAELREKYILDTNTALYVAKQEGLKERRNQTEKLNGMKEAKLEDAKKMKEEGINIETISNITGLSKAEIEKL